MYSSSSSSSFGLKYGVPIIVSISAAIVALCASMSIFPNSSDVGNIIGSTLGTMVIVGGITYAIISYMMIPSYGDLSSSSDLYSSI
jgi:hypothetical protein